MRPRGEGGGAAREGVALFQGIVRCGRCGRRMTVAYSGSNGRSPSYVCVRAFTTTAPRHASRSGGQRLDDAVAAAFLEAVTPAGVSARTEAAGDSSADTKSACGAAAAVERAAFEASRAERAFHACEPENRLVARSLETRWEQKLRELAEAEAELAEQTAPAPEPSREQLEALARDVPALWAADSTSEQDRKRLLRALIADVTITSQPDGREVSVGIRWRSGAAEQHTIQRPQSVNDTTRTPPGTVELIRRLAPRRTNMEIASELHAAGLRTGKGCVRRARRAPHPPRPQHSRDGTAHRWPAHRQRGRRAPGHLARRDLRLDLTRQTRRPPRPRQPPTHPVRPRHRAGLPRTDRELQPIPQTKIAATRGAV